jgi:hypothetical protein
VSLLDFGLEIGLFGEHDFVQGRSPAFGQRKLVNLVMKARVCGLKKRNEEKP